MNERLKIFTKKILNRINVEFDNAQQVYDYLVDFMRRRREFFEDMDPNETIKLTLYIYSFKSTGSFDLAEKIFDKLVFMTVINTNMTPTISECVDCDGHGRIPCDNCNGEGKERCEECEGQGRITCSECDGEGEVEGDNGKEECAYCEGEGTVECDECGGDGEKWCLQCDNGDMECITCDGSGEVEDEYKMNFFVQSLCSWSKVLNDLCEIREQTDQPVSEDGNLVENNEELISLSTQEYSLEPESFVKEGYYYCVSVDDSPRLVLDRDMRISVEAPRNSLRLYGTP